MTVSLLVAVARNGVIGRDNDLPWRLSEDLRRFKALTMGHPLIMGRRTYESIGRPLPGRRNLVLSRDPSFQAPGIEVHRSLPEALAAVEGDEEIFVIGGASLYAAALPLADRIYLTRVEAEVEGDVHFPEIDTTRWTLRRDEPFAADGRNEHDVRFQLWERSDRD